MTGSLAPFSYLVVKQFRTGIYKNNVLPFPGDPTDAFVYPDPCWPPDGDRVYTRPPPSTRR
jgi:hypothetical protein